jgi:hypothetical protein
MKEKEILTEIRRLQIIMQQCNEIEKSIKEICVSLNILWDREYCPPVYSIIQAVETDLKKLRVYLCEVRGE